VNGSVPAASIDPVDDIAFADEGMEPVPSNLQDDLGATA